MKLPSINYDTPVQSLGRQNITGPISVANAEASALLKVGGVALDVAEMAKGAEQDNALIAFTKAAEETNATVAEYKTRPSSESNVGELESAIKEIEDRHRQELGFFGNRTFDDNWNKYSSQKRSEFVVHEVYTKNNEQRVQTQQHVNNLAKTGDLPTAIGVIENATMFTESEKAEMRSGATTQHAISIVEKTIYAGTPEEMLAVRDQIASETGGYASIFDEGQRRQAISWLDTAYDSAVAEDLAKFQHAQERYASNLEVAVKTGQPEGNPVAIEQAFNSDAITGAKRTDLLLAWEKQQGENADMAERAALISHAIETQQPLDPKNPVHKKAVAEAYENRMAHANDPSIPVADKPAAQRAAFEYGVQLSIKTNIMPAKMEADFRTHAIAGKPQSVMFLSNAYEILEREAPQTLHNIGTDYVAIYGSVASLNRAGMPLDGAVELARNNAKATPAEKDALSTRYRLEKKAPAERLQSKINSSPMDINVFGSPNATPAMEGSYAALENEFFRLTGGDIELASDLAFRELSRVYSGTKVNGKVQVMPYAPERETQITADRLRGQLKTIAKKHKVPIDNLVVVPDGQTARDTGTKSYVLYQTDDLGLPTPVTDENGFPVRWTPNIAANRQLSIDEAKVKWEETKRYEERSRQIRADMRAKEKEDKEKIRAAAKKNKAKAAGKTDENFIPQM